MDEKMEEIKFLVAQLQNEVEELKGGDTAITAHMRIAGGSQEHPSEALQEKYRELQQKVERIEGNLGVDKIVLTDIGDKVLVTVQTPLGSVPVTLPHTLNTSMKSSARAGTLEPSFVSGSTVAMAPAFTAMKGGPPAGMTTEQLQDFKKQTLQINQLQQKIKDLELRITDANGLIKRGEDVTLDLSTKVSEDVKEIYMYLDDINTTMSMKIAAQRVEMEKLAGDTPQPINYDPFNYGEAYAGDVVDFEARKRIVEMDLLFQSLQIAMNQMKDAVRVSPSIDLGYKVVRLDQLVEATGFGPAIRNGDLTTDNGLVVNQATKIDPPERRYPRKEAFQTDEEKEYQWSITDSIMQTMYRLEVELGHLQKSVGIQDVPSNTKDFEETIQTFRATKVGELDENYIRSLIDKECKLLMNKRSRSSSMNSEHKGSLSYKGNDPMDMSTVEKLIQSLRDQIRHLELQVDTLYKQHPERREAAASSKVHPSQFNPYTNPSCKNLDSFYKQPVKLRYLLQRVFRYQTTNEKLAFYRMPRPVGMGYEKAWPKTNEVTIMAGHGKPEMTPETKAIREIKNAENIASLVEPQTEEYFIKGKDGRWYKGDKGNTKDGNTKQHKEEGRMAI